MRKRWGAGAVVLVAVVAAACSSGDHKVSTSARTTPAPGDSSVTATTTPESVKVLGKHASKRSKRAGAKSTSAGFSRGGSSAAGSSPAGGSNAASSGGNSHTTGGTVGGTAPSGPHGTTPHTTPSPPTTIEVAVPYDPSKPINLCCTPGVTAAEQARAEQLLRDTLRDLPKYADYNVAYHDGYRSIGDGFTGDEHWVNWWMVNDGLTLDSKFPESLVYDTRTPGKKTLEAAMYMLPFGSRFTDAPDVGGALTQWHIHNNLCLSDNPSDPLQKVIVPVIVGPDQECPTGSTKAGSTPMLHVWIVKNKCGPFAPLEGIGGGQVPPGETPLCDKLHGSVF